MLLRLGIKVQTYVGIHMLSVTTKLQHLYYEAAVLHHYSSAEICIRNMNYFRICNVSLFLVFTDIPKKCYA
jgi:hypothetical protein